MVRGGAIFPKYGGPALLLGGGASFLVQGSLGPSVLGPGGSGSALLCVEEQVTLSQ